MEEKNYIRRIDDLGRIVIPKKLRQELMVRENDAFEISVTAINEKLAFCVMPHASAGEGALRQAQSAMVALARQFPAGYELGLLDSVGVSASAETGKKAWAKPNWPLLDKEARMVFEEAQRSNDCYYRETEEKEVLCYPIRYGGEVGMVLCIAGKDISQDEAALVRTAASVISAMLA